MPFHTSVRRALSAATLFVAFGNGQQCYYPDGTLSTDTPCSSGGASSCCGAGSFCMDNGLCFSGGITSRGSCTEKSWNNAACTGYCKADQPNRNIALIPCSNNGASSTFVCGLDASCSNQTAVFSMSGTGSIVLRPYQVEAIVDPAIKSIEASSNFTSPSTANLYTSSQMAGLGCGLGIPLLFTLIALWLLYRREQRSKPPKLMYKLPDNHNDFIFHGHTAPPAAPSLSPISRTFSPYPPSRDGSVQSDSPAHMQSFFERYQTMSEKSGRFRAAELPGSPIAHELSETKLGREMSRGQ